MPLPTARLGLVVCYGFVWAGGNRRRPPDAGKDRPCVIVDLEMLEGPGARQILRATYLPISHVAPRTGEQALAVPPRVAAHLNLTAERSWLYASYAVEDDWPFDLARVPGQTDRFDYGFIPPRLFAAVAEAFRNYMIAHPGFIHRP